MLQGEQNNHMAPLEGNAWHDAIKNTHSKLEKQIIHSVQVGATGRLS